MKPEDVLDAMNQIDDKWIEPVERLRTKEQARRRFRENSFRIMKAAACICILVLGVFTFNHLEIMQRDTSDVSTADQIECVAEEGFEEIETESANTADSDFSTGEIKPSENADTTVQKAEGTEDSYDNTLSEMIKNRENNSTVALVISKLEQDGFEGVICNFKNTDVQEDHTANIKVKYDANTKIKDIDGAYKTYSDIISEEHIFRVGTKVLVTYGQWNVYKKREDGIIKEEITVWAKQIEVMD